MMTGTASVSQVLAVEVRGKKPASVTDVITSRTTKMVVAPGLLDVSVDLKGNPKVKADVLVVTVVDTYTDSDHGTFAHTGTIMVQKNDKENLATQ